MLFGELVQVMMVMVCEGVECQVDMCNFKLFEIYLGYVCVEYFVLLGGQ